MIRPLSGVNSQVPGEIALAPEGPAAEQADKGPLPCVFAYLQKKEWNIACKPIYNFFSEKLIFKTINIFFWYPLMATEDLKLNF